MASTDTDFRLYLVTSGTDRHTVDTAAKVAAAGAGVVQVRAKDLSTRDLLSLVTECATAVYRANPHTKVVVDDRADVAYAARRAGVPVNGTQELLTTSVRALSGRRQRRIRAARPSVLTVIGRSSRRQPCPLSPSGT